MKKPITILTLTLFVFFAKGQHFDTIQISRIVGSYWSNKNSINEEITFILDSSSRSKYVHSIYNLNKRKSKKDSLVFDTVNKKGILLLSKNEYQKINNYIDSNIETNNRISIYNLIINSSKSDLNRSLKIKNYDLKYQVSFKRKLDKYDLEDIKNDICINEYIKYIEDKRKSFSFSTDITNVLYIQINSKGKSKVLKQDFLDDMGQPYYIFKKEDSAFQRYFNIETNSVLKTLVKDFKNFKTSFDTKIYLNSYILWYFRNEWDIKRKIKKIKET